MPPVVAVIWTYHFAIAGGRVRSSAISAVDVLGPSGNRYDVAEAELHATSAS